MQIMVLGMHRAGTSAVARLINLMGAYIGPEDQYLPATADNPKGYWERIDVLQLHEWLMAQLGADWYLVGNIDLQSIGPETHQAFVQQARRILQGLEGQRPWVLKDPRLCLLLPLWLPLLEVPICIHVVRHPLATARSLEKRDDFPLHFGIALWEEYMAQGLIASTGLPRFAVCYEQLMAQPVATVRSLYENLLDYGVRGLHLPTEREITAFLDTDFQHHHADEERDAQWLTAQQLHLWTILRDAQLDALDPQILHDPTRSVRLNGYETLLRERRILVQRHLECDALQQQIDENSAQLTEGSARLVATQAELQQQDALLQRQASEMQTLMRLFESLHHATHLAFDSMSWRVGFALAEAGRKLGLLRRTPLVQDHIAQIARNYQSWQRRQSATQNLVPWLNDQGFDEAAYLAQYPDVRLAVERGAFASGREHFEARGREEIASGARLYIPQFLSNTCAVVDAQQAQRNMAQWTRQPLISIIMPVYNVEQRWLEAAINSVQQQLYPNWELCIADDASTRSETRETLRKLEHPRCKITFLERNQGIAAASNAAIALASGEYVTFLDHDDELTTDALYHVVKAIHEHDPDFIYSDEDKLSLEGYYLEQHFKPDYSPDLLLSTNYICHLSVYRKTLLEQVAADGQYLRQGFEGSQDYDLVLRVLEHTQRVYHIPRILYHWRKIPGSTAARYESKNHAWEAGRLALEDALQRRGISAQTMCAAHPGCYRVQRNIKGLPLVSILIPFRDQADLLQALLDSILRKTAYPRFEVIGISNNSVEASTFAVMQRYARADARVRFINYDAPFNYSAINNFAANQALGEYLLLLNNDMTVINAEWLEALLEHAQRPEVGAVGGKLYYPDGTVQHAGVIVGVGGVAGHAHKNFPGDHHGYFMRLGLIQNLSAVTAACLMVKKALYLAVGGMDEKNLPIAFNDVDFCLRLREQGYLNVFTPYCELYHHESKSRGAEDTPQKKRRFIAEIVYIQKRHAALLQAGDPYYNPNLPLDRDDFGML